MDMPDLKDLFETLKQERDELRVKVHLGKAEIKEEWDDIEDKWDKLRGKAGVVFDQASDASQDVTAAAKLMLGEIRDGYKRIRRTL